MTDLTPQQAADIVTTPDFDGETYERGRDHDRLAKQMGMVRRALQSYDWMTLEQLVTLTGAPAQSVSARIRDLRKVKHGGYVIHREYVSRGVWRYRMDPDLRRTDDTDEPDEGPTPAPPVERPRSVPEPKGLVIDIPPPPVVETDAQPDQWYCSTCGGTKSLTPVTPTFGQYGEGVCPTCQSKKKPRAIFRLKR